MNEGFFLETIILDVDLAREGAEKISFLKGSFTYEADMVWTSSCLCLRPLIQEYNLRLVGCVWLSKHKKRKRENSQLNKTLEIPKSIRICFVVVNLLEQNRNPSISQHHQALKHHGTHTFVSELRCNKQTEMKWIPCRCMYVYITEGIEWNSGEF